MIFKENFIINDSILSNYQNIYAKFEPIVTENMDIFSNEILFRLNSFDNSHLQVLENLREKEETFSLFVRIIRKAFDDSFRTGRTINVNLEIQDILNDYFLDYLYFLLDIYKISPKKINFELLEDEDISFNNELVFIKKIKELSEIGFLFSIDDLFSGYSNKNRIKFLLSNGIKISTIKVDGKFLRNMFDSYRAGFSMPDIIKYDGKQYFNYSLDDFDDFKKYIGELHDKGIKIVAEWIENEEMFNFAKDLGFDYFQGYYIQNLNSSIQEI